MFFKFVALILIFGATGIGVLSVRQSRLQAVHEMAESRYRALQLNEQAGEIRSLIVRSSTPQRVHELIKSEGAYVPASSTPAEVVLIEQVIEPIQTQPDPIVQADPVEDIESTRLVFTLSDGTRVVLIGDQKPD